MECIHWLATIDDTPAVVVRMDEILGSGSIRHVEIVFDRDTHEVLCGSVCTGRRPWRAYGSHEMADRYQSYVAEARTYLDRMVVYHV